MPLPPVVTVANRGCNRCESRTLLPLKPPATPGPQSLQLLGIAYECQQASEMQTLLPLSAFRKPLNPLGLVKKRSFEPLLRFSALSGHSSNLRDFQNHPCKRVNPTPPGVLHLMRTPSCAHGEPHNQDTFRIFNAQRATVLI